MKGTTQILISGFGGQGALFAGKFLAYCGLLQGMEVSWLPSYGPEMRGGTASCAVILSDAPVGSPIVTEPDALIAMNLPSLDRYERAIAPGGMAIYDSALIARAPARADIRAFGVPAARIAGEEGIKTLGNMLLIGQLLRRADIAPEAIIEKALQKVVSAKHADMLDMNRKAIALGRAWGD